MRFRIRSLMIAIVAICPVLLWARPFVGTMWILPCVIFPGVIILLGVLLAVIHIAWFEPKYSAQRPTAEDRSPGWRVGPRPLAANSMFRMAPRSGPEFGPSRQELRLQSLDDR
jgi:hypothetical protein